MDSLAQYSDEILAATGTTIALTALILLISTACAIPLAAIHSQRGRVAVVVLSTFSWTMRALPILLLMFVLYYGLPAIGFRLSPFFAAVVALSVGAIAYNMEIFRGGFQAVPRQQFEAGKALGLSRSRIWLQIIFPQAMVAVIPPYMSNCIRVVKGTSLASAITVMELTHATNEITAVTFQPFEFLGTAAVIYIILSTLILGAQKLLERRFRRHIMPAKYHRSSAFTGSSRGPADSISSKEVGG